ncbi:RNA polymerase sigma factor [Nannocystis radixulma]|uniref:RNA polymerase sigma factor n=1 Tax=Nannocystis radixulma TaxID=2995305 RepID=A0ABT5BM16_9BACT|nr:RNA polymerase sigma factor [Nannocystis radixulma]MDC0675208.1 RNA polymerase sigma factor [Nannocystis radixulma]
MGSLLQLLRPAPAPSATDPEAREAELVARARGGDIEAWSRLYQEHFDRVFRHLAYLTGDTHAAEDLVQETFARAFVGLAQFEGRGSFAGWLRGIAVNIVRKHWRSRYRGDQAMDRLEVASAERSAGTDADPEGAHLRQKRAEVLLAVLDTLPAPLREAFVLCDLQEMPVQAAAAELGVSPGNLRVRATRARARIRGELVRLGWLAEDSHAKEQDHADA